MEALASDSGTRRISTQKLSVVLTDDHDLVRYAIRSFLQESGKYEVVGESPDAESTIELIEAHKPDLVLIDIGLPGKSGLETIYQIKERGLPTRVVVLTMYDDETKLKQALAAGACGYLLKHSSPEILLAKLARITAGEVVVPEKFEYVREKLSKTHEKESNLAEDPLDKLSRREREIFFLIAEGSPNRVIAKKLFISPRTVETHRARVIKKLGFGSTADLIRYAIRHSLLSA